MARRVTGLGVAAALLIAAPLACADTCYDLYNSRNVDCDTQSPRGGAPAQAAPPKPAPDTSRLRDELRRRLNEGTGTESRATPEQLGSRISEAQQRVDQALRDPGAPGARERYDAAMKDLRRAYSDAGKDASPAGRAALAGNQQRLEAHYAEQAARADWGGVARPAASPAAAESVPTAASDEAAPAPPVNVTEVNGYVYVCDGPVDGAHASCREIQRNGFQCIAITADEGVMGWRDSIDTPCSADDLAQRNAFLERRREEAGTVSLAAMNDQCRDLALTYVAAADAGNGPAAQTALESLQKAGGCGVLSKAQVQTAPAAADPRFVSRGATPMLDETVVPCDQQPDACAAMVNQLRAGTSPEAVAALYSNAIAIGLEIGAAMGQAVLTAQQTSLLRAGQTNMNSLAPAPIRATRPSTPAPVYHPAPPIPGCRIGGVGWCTAQ